MLFSYNGKRRMNPLKPFLRWKTIAAVLVIGMAAAAAFIFTGAKTAGSQRSILGFETSSAYAAGKIDAEITVSPFARKLAVAVPSFVAATQDAGAQDSATNGTQLMRSILDFTGFFDILNPRAFIDNLSSGVTEDRINFRNWKGIGAEYMVTGSVENQGGILYVELRFMDAINGKLVVGKRYKSQPDQIRRVVRKFASEILWALYQTRGCFDTRIAFVSTSSGNKEIYVCDFDGYNPVAITRGSKIAVSPSWSHNGQHIAYTSYRQGGAHIYIQGAQKAGGVMGTVVKFQGTNITPAWHPAQFVLAACMSFSGDPEIYSLTGDGKIIKRLTNNWGIDVSPSWSPDGSQVAFVSNRSGGPQVYILTVATGQVSRLTYRGRYNTAPAWSPKGGTIAYSGLEAGEFNIYIVSASGGEPLQLTRDAGNNESPTWSPDGMLLAYMTDREGPDRVYVMTALGSDERRLLSMPGEQSEPDWSPNLGDF